MFSDDDKMLMELLSSDPSTNLAANAEFATPDNLTDATTYLRHALCSEGISHWDIILPSSTPHDQRASSHVANALHALLARLARARDRHLALDDASHRARSDARLGDQSLSQALQRIHALERDLASATQRSQQSAAVARQDALRFQTERDDLKRQCNALQYRHAQMTHELKRREVDRELLQEKLRSLLQERSREKQAAEKTLGQWKEGKLAVGGEAVHATKTSTLSSSSSSMSMHPRTQASQAAAAAAAQMHSLYEDKVAALASENRDLRAALETLQSEHVTLLNKHSKQIKSSWAGGAMRVRASQEEGGEANDKENGNNNNGDGKWRDAFILAEKERRSLKEQLANLGVMA